MTSRVQFLWSMGFSAGQIACALSMYLDDVLSVLAGS